MPVIENKTQLTIDDLKTIIHGIRMASFSFVEDDAMVEINAMIKALPLPEEIDKMAASPGAIKNLQEAIGNIMKLVETYGKRDVEYKVRYRSRTNLPPRYKVLEWRDNMRTDAVSATKELVRLSSLAEEKGYGEESSKLLKCAKKIIVNQAEEKDVEEVVASLKNIGLEKEAQAWQKMKGFFGGLGQGVKGALTNIWQSGQAGGMEAEYQALYNQLDAFKKKIDKYIKQPGLSEQVKQRVQALAEAITYSGDQISKAAEGVKQSSEAAPQTAAPADVGQAAQTAQAPQVAQTPQATGQVENVAEAVRQPAAADGSTDVAKMNDKQLRELNTQILREFRNRKQKAKAPATAPATANMPSLGKVYNLKTYKLAHRK